MVDRLKKWLSVEVLEDRTLPSTNPAILVLGASGVATPPQAAAVQSATLFVGGPAAAALQTNGDVVEVGQAATSPPGGSSSTAAGGSTAGLLALLRFTPDGHLDAGFGTGGEVWTSIRASAGETCGLTVQLDGKIVLTVATAGATSVTVARFDPDGSPDNTFAAGGLSSLSLSPVTGVSSSYEGAVSGVVNSLNAAVVYIFTYTPPAKDSSSASVSVSIDLGTVVSPNSQVPWTKGRDPGSSGGSFPVGQGALFQPVRFAPIRGSDPHPSPGVFSTAAPTQLAWTRTSDSLLAWNDYALATQALASLQVTLALLEGGDARLSGGEEASASQFRPTLLYAAELPSYLHDFLVVPPVSLAAPAPSDVPPPDRPAMTTGDEGLPAYLIRSDTAVVNSTDGGADLATANESQDAGLAAVDAALLLIGAGKNPAVDPEVAVLPSETREQQPERPRGVSWPLWFVLLVAASGGGAAWQASGGGLPGLRRLRRGTPARG